MHVNLPTKGRAMALLNARNSCDWQSRHNSLSTCASDVLEQLLYRDTIQNTCTCIHIYTPKKATNRTHTSVYVCHMHMLSQSQSCQKILQDIQLCMHMYVHMYMHMYTDSDKSSEHDWALNTPQAMLGIGYHPTCVMAYMNIHAHVHAVYTHVHVHVCRLGKFHHKSHYKADSYLGGRHGAVWFVVIFLTVSKEMTSLRLSFQSLLLSDLKYHKAHL